MPRGGARAVSGPAPDPNALRRDRDDAGWFTLPPCREGDAPAWPLEGQTPREVVFWEREWRRPQAVMWERHGQQTEVAMYVRALAEAEKLDASVASRTLMRQFQESLGISLPGLARNRWRIAASDPGAKTAPRRSQPSTRERFRVVTGDDVA